MCHRLGRRTAVDAGPSGLAGSGGSEQRREVDDVVDVSNGRGFGLSDAQSRRLAAFEAQGGPQSELERGELQALRACATGADVMRVTALQGRSVEDVGKEERRSRLKRHECPTCGQSLREGGA